jgi:ABC-2 type transport system permease protein
LMFNDGQGYIRYQKGALVFYAISDYIGEKVLNQALKKYVEKVRFQQPPYTTTIEMVDYIREVTPDSLRYTIEDMFEKITLYNNEAINFTTTALDNGQFRVAVEFNVSKYRNDEKGRIRYSDNQTDSLSYQHEGMLKPQFSLPLEDYIDIGIFGEVEGKEVELYLKKHKITAINNRLTIIVDQKPVEVGVDPYNKLIDANPRDNRKGA